MSEIRLIRYLPVRIIEQNYSIVMDIVLAVQPTAGDEPAYATMPSATLGTAETGDLTGSSVPKVDLGILFGGTWRQSAPPYAVIVATPAGTCALLVDAISSPVSVSQDNVFALPYLVTLTGCPFSAMISAKQEMLPVIDVTRLLEHLRIAPPDLTTEVDCAG
jgi:chemotaxis signal transduction protein